VARTSFGLRDAYLFNLFVSFHSESSCSLDLPLQILDADLCTRFLIIVEPFSFLEIDAAEDRRRLEPFGFPFALLRISYSTKWKETCY
jgi:hypothetical protein